MKIFGFDVLGNRLVHIFAKVKQIIIHSEADDVPLKILTHDGNVLEKVDKDGFKKIKYKNIHVSGDWVNTTGGAVPDDLNVTVGTVIFRMKSFDGAATTEWLSGSFEITNEIALTEVNSGVEKIEIVIHYAPSDNTSGVVKWFFEYSVFSLNKAAVLMPTITTLKTIGVNQRTVLLTSTVELQIPSGMFNVGDIILFNIRRVPTDIQDTYNARVLFFKCSLNIPVNDFGSRNRYIK